MSCDNRIQMKIMELDENVYYSKALKIGLDKMKLKYCFSFAAVLIVLLSLACVAASENMTDGLSLQDGDVNRVDAVSVDENKLSSNDNVDLSIEMDVESSCIDGKYNTVGSEVPWTVSVTANGGTARNTQVREILSSNLVYISHNATMGTYDPSSGIWKVGDLTSSSTASLTILTKLNNVGTYLNKAYATTDSNDKNLMNNFGFLSIKTDSSKSTSNITETTDDRMGSSHTFHYGSMISDRIREDDSNFEEDRSDDKKSDDKKEAIDAQNNGYSKYSLTNMQSFIQKISSSDSNSSSSSKSNPSNMHENPMLAYDYTKVPILIFTLFLVMLFGIVAGDKIKDKF